MNDSHDWFKSLETATQDFEQFVRETLETMAEAATEAADAMAQIPLAIAEQMEGAIVRECDRMVETLDEWFAPPVHFSTRVEMHWDLDTLDPWNETMPPSPTHHPACIGCRHYHGRIYNGTPLICGMHPYGWEGKTCPDWET